jgi:hypothetical protein
MATARAAAGSSATAARHLRVEHRGTLRWIARRWTGSADEAEGALQRAMEIYLRRLDSIDAATELLWLEVVVHRTVGRVLALTR